MPRGHFGPWKELSVKGVSGIQAREGSLFLQSIGQIARHETTLKLKPERRLGTVRRIAPKRPRQAYSGILSLNIVQISTIIG